MAQFELAERFNLDISLFERLVNNNFDSVTLEYQRRMRPRIADPIRVLYPNLKDHKTEAMVPDVTCVGANYRFFSHAYPEEKNVAGSKLNPMEAGAVMDFACDLVRAGYK